LRKRFASVAHAQGSILADGAPVVMPGTALQDLRAEYRVDGKTVLARAEPRIDLDLNRAAPGPGVPSVGWHGRWTARFVPPGPGRYRLVLDQAQCWKDCTVHD
ncbi:hypothetical protein, partial [Klebsiella aerogenes]